jgi:hypothetical protein
MTRVMKYDVVVSLASNYPPGAEETSAGHPTGDSNVASNSSDQSIEMAQQRSDHLVRLPPVQPFPLAAKDSSRAAEAPTREPARHLNVRHNSSENGTRTARAPLPAAEQPSLGRRIFQSVASFFVTALIATLTAILVSHAWDLHGDKAKAMVRTLASSAWQSRGDEAKRMVKEAWTSSLDWVMKKLPPDVDLAGKQKGSSPAGQVSTRDAALPASVVANPAPVATAVSFDSVQQLKTMAQDLTLVRQKIEQLTDAQQQMTQKIASLQALQQDIKQKESSPPSSPAVPVPLRKIERTVAAPPAPRAILRDWWINNARNGHVYVQGHGNVYRVVPGTPLPGLGAVEQIKRQNGRWVVMTPKGIIASMRDLESDDEDMFDGN